MTQNPSSLNVVPITVNGFIRSKDDNLICRDEPAANLFNHSITASKTLDRWDVDFHLVDSKGRRIGYHFLLEELTSKPWERGMVSLYSLPHTQTRHFRLFTHVTRDGKTFGASHGAIYSADHAEVMALGAARMDAAKARYAKTCTAVHPGTSWAV